MGLLTFLLGSKLGRYIAIAGLGVMVVLSVLTVFYRKGVNAERAKAQARRLEAIKDAVIIRDDVQAMTKDERRKELESWARD